MTLNGLAPLFSPLDDDSLADSPPPIPSPRVPTQWGPREWDLPRLVYLQLPYLKRPLRVEVSPGDDTAICLFSSQLRVGGTGDTLVKALIDLIETAADLYDALSETSDEELDPSALDLRDLLRVVFEPA